MNNTYFLNFEWILNTVLILRILFLYYCLYYYFIVKCKKLVNNK